MSLLDPRAADADAFFEAQADRFLRGDGAVFGGIRWAVDADGEVDLDRCEYADALEAERWFCDGEDWPTRGAFFRFQDREPYDGGIVPRSIAGLAYDMAQLAIDAAIGEGGSL